MTSLTPTQRRTAAYCLGASILYGFSNYLSGKFNLPGCSFAELRPQIVLPMFMGIMYGPVAGFAVGCLGDSLGYTFAGHSPLHAWNWSIGNGLIGMIPGFCALLGVRRIKSIRDFEIMLGLVILASSLPILFAIGLDSLRYVNLSFYDATYTLFFPIFITDAVWGVLLLPAMLLRAKRLIVTIETRTMLMVTYMTVLAVLGTYAASIFTTWDRKGPAALVVADLYTVGIVSLIVLILALAVSAYFARRLTSPVVCLTDAAGAIAKGDYSPSPALEQVSRREDELGQLAGVFRRMSEQVHQREQGLRQEVRELKIEIDRSKQQQEVAKITGSDYFKNLRIKAKRLRNQND